MDRTADFETFYACYALVCAESGLSTLAREQVHALAEARALALAKSPRRALRRTNVSTPTLAKVGEERERLERQRREERENRKGDYKLVMEIMKRRGAKRPPKRAAAPGRRRAPAARAESFNPLRVFAEGDSWFDYPVPLFGGGIVDRLEKKLGIPILNMAEAGDEVRSCSVLNNSSISSNA